MNKIEYKNTTDEWYGNTIQTKNLEKLSYVFQVHIFLFATYQEDNKQVLGLTKEG